MHLREGEFSRAHTDFFEAFKNYDESGSPRCVSGRALAFFAELVCFLYSNFKATIFKSLAMFVPVGKILLLIPTAFSLSVCCRATGLSVQTV